MAIIVTVIILVLIGTGLYYFNELAETMDRISKLENDNAQLKSSNETLKDRAYQAEERATRHFEKLQKIRTELYQTQNFGSVQNLQNKLKAILDDSNSSNIN